MWNKYFERILGRMLMRQIDLIQVFCQKHWEQNAHDVHHNNTREDCELLPNSIMIILFNTIAWKVNGIQLVNIIAVLRSICVVCSSTLSIANQQHVSQNADHLCVTHYYHWYSDFFLLISSKQQNHKPTMLQILQRTKRLLL